MRISSLSLIAALALSTLSAPALAFDPDAVFARDAEPRTILRFGYKALKQGRIDDALGAFRFGAQKRDVAAQWKLGRMLQMGDGVARDDAAAYEIFNAIADRYASEAPLREDVPFVSHAVVSVGVYLLRGIEASGLISSPHDAESYFYRAAALYGDAEAQYRLGWLLRSDLLGHRQPGTAARWLKLASRKGHVHAQAELADMLMAGDGVRPNRVRALVLLAEARAKGGVTDVESRFTRVWDAASATEREQFAALADGQPAHSANTALGSTNRSALEQPVAVRD